MVQQLLSSIPLTLFTLVYVYIWGGGIVLVRGCCCPGGSCPGGDLSGGEMSVPHVLSIFMNYTSIVIQRDVKFRNCLHFTDQLVIRLCSFMLFELYDLHLKLILL